MDFRLSIHFSIFADTLDIEQAFPIWFKGKDKVLLLGCLASMRDICSMVFQNARGTAPQRRSTACVYHNSPLQGMPLAFGIHANRSIRICLDLNDVDAEVLVEPEAR